MTENITTLADLDGMTQNELFEFAMTCEEGGPDNHCLACEAFAVWTFRNPSANYPSMVD